MADDLVLVGCGAIAQGFYLPSLSRQREKFKNIWLVDPSERVLAAASAMIDAKTARDLSEVKSGIDLAIISAPNKFHFPLAQQALEKGAHVLVEKPVTIWPKELESLVQTAARTNRIVAVNQTRRCIPFVRDLRRRISAGEFGAFRSATHYEGQKLAWPFESGAAFHRTAQRTGVVMDFGVHVIDMYEYLLKPEWKYVSAMHDGFNGPEGLSEIRLEANGAPIFIRLSRYFKQENVARLRFDRALIEINLDQLNTYSVKDEAGRANVVTARQTMASYDALADDIVANFVAAAAGQVEPLCAASASAPVITILDEIYRNAKLYPAEIGVV